MYINELKECGFSNPYDTALTIHTANFDYSLCFIERETEKYLDILVTMEDGREKLRIVSKKDIESVDILYQDDISFEKPGESNKDKMFQ